MITFAYIGLHPTVREGALLAGLLLAAILLAIFAFGHVKIATSKRGKLLLAALSLIGFAGIVVSMSDPASRLLRLRRTIDTVESIQQFCFGLSDADVESFGAPLDTDTWERVPPDGYKHLIARAKSEGRLRDAGGNWTSDGQLVDFWHHPFRIAVSVQGGKRVVIVDSLGPDGAANTIDDIQRSGSVDIRKQ
ncbi:MAG: hypothetical protein WEB58_21765 [Planctomycetaceae bacterium]